MICILSRIAMKRLLRIGIYVVLVILSNHNFSSANDDTLNTSQTIRDNQTLVSSQGKFELGFFSPANSDNRYLGIWYKNINVRTVIWVANRETPLRYTTSCVLTLVEPGILIILDDTNSTVWSSSNISTISAPVRNPVAQLLDSGNLVLRDADQIHLLWQSFDHPTDTFLPGMNFGLSSLSPWRTNDDPAPGDFTVYLDSTGYPQMVARRPGEAAMYRMGPWNGITFSGVPNVRKDSTFRFGLYRNREGMFYGREDAIDKSIISRFTLSPNGVAQRWTWVEQRHDWVLYLNIPADNCDSYRLCGAYGSCNIVNSPVCGCLEKFVPNDLERWGRADWSNGCVRRTKLNCSKDGFLKYSDIKLPDARNTWYDERMTLEECRVECLRNCSCMAYTSLDISRGGSGCLIWFGDLVDIRVLPKKDGQDIYIRLASSELGSRGQGVAISIVSLTLVGMVMLGLGLLLYCLKSKKSDTIGIKSGRKEEIHSHNTDLELPLFDLSTILKATNKFSLRNKLGEGGYGPVFKGTLEEEGQEIAVKRLSKTSMQGVDEFKNEVICISKLQHRNLVKLLGCCLEAEEMMLIYEYMPNNSLDSILFNQKKRMALDWPQRFNIVNGVARGLNYLHQDSRLRIIHRDLKASNILLDSEMKPKISDFGIAKRFRGNETEDMTNRVVGTYGYMSPEYTVHGRYSEKSDVFSFGVIVLEIVSAKRNRASSYGDRHLNLLGQAWTLYKEGRSVELVDTCLNENDSDSISEVQRLIHVGLLCVQQYPEERPSMTLVVSMLSNEIVLPQANHPGFFTDRDMSISESTSSTNPTNSVDEVTITRMGGR